MSEAAPSSSSTAAAAGSGQQKPLVRVTLWIHRRPEWTEEAFHQHWSEVHGPLVRPLLERYGIVRYTQIHTPRKTTKLLEGIRWHDIPVELTEYDGCAEFVMPDISCIVNAMKDPYHDDVVAKDELQFIDIGRSRVSVGYEHPHILNGKIVEGEARSAFNLVP